MPPAAAIAGGAGLSAVGGIFGASEAANAAKNARRTAAQQYAFAMNNRPEFFTLGPLGQKDLYSQLYQQFRNIKPEAFSAADERAARKSTRRGFAKETEVGRQRVAESSARRGLFRSGIGAQQEAQYLGDRGTALEDLLLNQRLQFQQQRANEMSRVNQQRQQALEQLQRFQQQGLSNQTGLFNTLLGMANTSGAGARQAQQAAGQAFGNMFSGPGNALMSAGMLGGFGGAGAPPGVTGGGLTPVNGTAPFSVMGGSPQQFGLFPPGYFD